MQIVYQRCCGMDVHKDSVTACVLLIDEYGEWRSEKREFRTMTRDLREMATWLASLQVEAIAFGDFRWRICSPGRLPQSLVSFVS